MYDELKQSAETAARELIEIARLEPGDLMVVGCSSSEIGGHKIGSDSNEDIAGAVFSGIYGVVKEKGVFLATQCCEHLNRALILEKEAAKAYGLEPVNVVPQKKAGGSFSTAAYAASIASCKSAPRAVTPSTLPPEVTVSPSFMAVPAW